MTQSWRDHLHRYKFFTIAALIVFLTFATNYYGSTDLADYSDTARFLGGTYAADIRSSHSYLYGAIHAPFVAFFGSYIVFKITSLLMLALLTYSVYYLTGRNKKAFALMLLSPVVWYMAPWISPIQAASLCLLWAHHFIVRYDRQGSMRHLVYAGIAAGLGLAFWDTIMFFGAFLLIPYLWSKKSYHLIIVIGAILIGLLPRLFLDYSLFGFPFFSLLKSFMGTLTNAFFLGRGTTYANGIFTNLLFIVLILACVPWYFWKVSMQKSVIALHKKSLIFLALSLALIIVNPQIRYTLVLVPIMIVLIAPYLTSSQWKKQCIISGCITLLFIAPIVVQTAYSLNNSYYYDITEVLAHSSALSITSHAESEILAEDLVQLGNDYPDQMFLVFGKPDYYQKLAHLYWGHDIQKLVSVQDYELWKNNESTLFEKRLVFTPRIQDRRAIWIGGGILKNPNDTTDYASIRYALTLDGETPDPSFTYVRSYKQLKLFSR